MTPKAFLCVSLLALSGCASFHQGAMPGEPKGATFATIRGARVRYVDKGQGSPVVLVHGFASAIEAWSGVLPELAKTHRVIALDLKGFGWSDRPAGDYSPEEEARIVLELMSQRGIDKAAIVAHSWGSSIALAAALAQPARVSRLALYDAWVYEEQLPTFFHWAHADGLGETLFAGWYSERPDERIAMAFYDKRWVTEALVESVEDALERPGTVAAALAGVRGMHYAQTQDKYRTIKNPDAPHVGARGPGHHAAVRRAALARAAAVEAHRVPAVRALPDDRGARRLERRSRPPSSPRSPPPPRWWWRSPRPMARERRSSVIRAAWGFGLALATLAAPQQAWATGFTDIGSDLRVRDKVTVELDGYLRARSEALYNLDLDRGLLPSGQSRSFRCRSATRRGRRSRTPTCGCAPI